MIMFLVAVDSIDENFLLQGIFFYMFPDFFTKFRGIKKRLSVFSRPDKMDVDC